MILSTYDPFSVNILYVSFSSPSPLKYAVYVELSSTYSIKSIALTLVFKATLKVDAFNVTTGFVVSTIFI